MGGIMGDNYKFTSFVNKKKVILTKYVISKTYLPVALMR